MLNETGYTQLKLCSTCFIGDIIIAIEDNDYLSITEV